MNKNNNNLINFSVLDRLKSLQGKKIKLVLCGDLRYTTSNLQVASDNKTIRFTDVRGEEIFCDISQINMVTEMKNDN